MSQPKSFPSAENAPNVASQSQSPGWAEKLTEFVKLRVKLAKSSSPSPALTPTPTLADASAMSCEVK
jgi:hypothetical protein